MAEPAILDTDQPAPSGYDDIIDVLNALPLICRETRRRKGQSLRAAAEQAGVSFSTLSRCETRTGEPSLGAVVSILKWAAS